MTKPKFPYIACCFALCASCMLYQLQFESAELEQLRTSARAGNFDSIRALSNTTSFLWPYERCAYYLWLARQDANEPTPIERIPYCTKTVLPEGFYIVQQYFETLPSPI